ncbi:hypothetical protein [Planobispora takensis]|uniref:PE-PGRS family protein n=1 Tax=Planobispora takensis TaxID=1367882 RepID=A0A8J3T2C4_9ACTN|nr:hypothetical protein [Planobispora takensis]GII02760.1 hypothetical protein Pta02_47680 [Planobispora takensis]
MQRWEKLNDRQLTVLRRIGEGEEPVSAKTPELANTVYALRGRGLITTPRKNGIWHAEITDAGRFYLQHGHHPDLPVPGRSNDAAVTRPPALSGRHDAHQGALRLAKDLIERLQLNGGTVEIENPDEGTRAAYRRAIHAAKQHGLVPAGFHLLHTGRNGGDLIIRLSDDAHSDETDWNRIRLGVRDKVTDINSLVEMLRTHPEILVVSDTLRSRALDLVRSLAQEAGRRGHKLAISKKRKARGLYVQVGTRQYPIAVKEEHDRVPRAPQQDARRRRRYDWERVPVEYELVPAGRLRLELPHSEHGQQDHWSDTPRSQVESKVREILKEVESRAKADEQAALTQRRQHEEWLAEQERKEAAERARWEEAMVRAHACALDDYHHKTFAKALDAWITTTEIREFCAALEHAAVDSPETEEAESARSWIEWGRALADRLDPVRGPSRLTRAAFDQDPAPDDLRPHLGDWSPHGPHKEYYRPQSQQHTQVSEVYGEGWWRGRQGRSQWWRR